MIAQPKALLIDITRCIGCRACVLACQSLHGFPGDGSDTELSATAYTALVTRGDLNVRKLCMHCLTPSCASVCPVAAIRKTAAGPVVYNSERCIGCRYCMLACPANVPRYEWNNPVPAVRKCDLCAERLERGEIPACAEVCPAGATVFGTRAELLDEAHRRIAENPGQYYPHVFGEKELGGTSVLALSPVSFASLGFPVNLGERPLPDLTWQALQRIPVVALVGGAALFAIYWITHRREILMKGGPREKEPREEEPREEGRGEQERSGANATRAEDEHDEIH